MSVKNPVRPQKGITTQQLCSSLQDPATKLAQPGTSCGRTPPVFVKAHAMEEPIICAAVHLPHWASDDWKLRHYYFLLLVTILVLSPVGETEATELEGAEGSETRKYTTWSRGRTANSTVFRMEKQHMPKHRSLLGHCYNVISVVCFWKLLCRVLLHCGPSSCQFHQFLSARLKSGSNRAMRKVSQNTVKPNCSLHL